MTEYTHAPRLPGAETIRTRRLLLEPLEVAHAQEMAQVLDDPALHAFTGGRPATVEELRARYRRQTAGSPDPTVTWCNWVMRLRDGERPAGYVQATAEGDVAEVAWVVGTPWQGRGIATEDARAVVSWLRDRGVRMIVAHVHPGHRASNDVAAAAGLTPTGRRQDGEVRWELRLSPPPEPAGERAS